MDDTDETIAVPDLLKFATDCFLAVGVPKSHSETMASTVVEADFMGHRSHGVYRLESWVHEAHSGIIDHRTTPIIEKESPATAWVNGRNALGPVVANFCMQLAIQKAKRVGAAIVVVKNSNNFGAAALYSRLALSEGLLGWAMTNANALLVPTGAKYATSGTNPISIAAPGLFGDYFLLDMSTTVASGGNIELRAKNGEYLPVGFALNAACLPETNADVAAKTMRYLPLGSVERLASYKGTGLSIMVDILTGILAGSSYGGRVGLWGTQYFNKKASNGHCFIAIDPKRFAPGFQMRMSEFMNFIRNMEPANPEKPVRVAGDRGREVMRKMEERGGIWYPKYVVESMKSLARLLKLQSVPFIPKPTAMVLSPSEELSVRLTVKREATRSGLNIIEQKEEDVIENISDIKDEGDVCTVIAEDSWDLLTGFEERKDRKYRRKPSIGSVVVRSVNTLSESVRESLYENLNM